MWQPFFPQISFPICSRAERFPEREVQEIGRRPSRPYARCKFYYVISGNDLVPEPALNPFTIGPAAGTATSPMSFTRLFPSRSSTGLVISRGRVNKTSNWPKDRPTGGISWLELSFLMDNNLYRFLFNSVEYYFTIENQYTSVFMVI